ncbi:hypothetical protein DB30_00242 [Enhygromyxa salina]|uniref:Uncharacterized protein n=1 Tax=Enhygromyxa salina TaxID=215803 RepID=A0A0C2DFW7_9BACT|nr:hypothetical protein DB30_00242 [Enhygromyxa salina]
MFELGLRGVFHGSKQRAAGRLRGRGRCGYSLAVRERCADHPWLQLVDPREARP